MLTVAEYKAETLAARFSVSASADYVRQVAGYTQRSRHEGHDVAEKIFVTICKTVVDEESLRKRGLTRMPLT